MQINTQAGDQVTRSSADGDRSLQRYGLGSTRFAGAPDALYERRLKFDNVVEPESSDARERYEAAARAVRDILSERWLRTDETWSRKGRRLQKRALSRLRGSNAEIATKQRAKMRGAAESIAERNLGHRHSGLVARELFVAAIEATPPNPIGRRHVTKLEKIMQLPHRDLIASSHFFEGERRIR